MKKVSSKFASFIKRHKVISISIMVVILLCAWWMTVNLTPKPLGDKLEYIGKKDYGCSIGFCDSQPYSVYYYGTDLSEQDLVKYFEKATFRSSQQETSTESLLHFDSTEKEEFYISYYHRKSPTSFPNTKKYVVSIPSFQYDTARGLLN